MADAATDAPRSPSSTAVTCARCGTAYALPDPPPLLAGCPRCGRAAGGGGRNALAAVLAVAAIAVLAVGVSTPFVEMTTLGRTRSFGVVSGVLELFRRGETLLGVVLGVFSVIFPFVKLLAILAATSRLALLSPRGRHLLARLAVLTGKYSLLDLLVVAVMIVIVKFDGLAEVSARVGVVWFTAAILLSLASGLLLDLRKLRG